jgi:CRP-like cAMP-binding protein
MYRIARKLKATTILIETELMTPVTHISKGISFGESALQFDKEYPNRKVQRQDTVRSLTDCVFLTLSKEDFLEALSVAED